MGRVFLLFPYFFGEFAYDNFTLRTEKPHLLTKRGFYLKKVFSSKSVV